MSDTRVVSPVPNTKTGDLPHMYSDAFKALWKGATITEESLREELYDSNQSISNPFTTIGYTELSTLVKSSHSPSDTVGKLWGVDSEKVVAAIEVSIQ